VPDQPHTSDAPPFDPEYDTTPTPNHAAGLTETALGATNGVPRDSTPTGPLDSDRNARPALADLAAERALLGALLVNPSACIPAATAIVHGANYHEPAHELIHDTIVALHAAGQPVDPVTVVDALRATGNLTRLPDNAITIHDLHAGATLTHAGAAESYAHIVRTTSRRRLLERTGIQLSNLARTGDLTQLDSILDQTYTTLDQAVTEYGPTSTTLTSWSPVNLGPVLDGDMLDPPPTMLARTDGVCLFYDQSVHTVAGEPESGKTWLVLHAARQELDKGHKVTMIDFEDRADRVVARLLALGATPQQITDQFAYVRPDRPLDDPGRHHLEPALVGRKLVIVDGVTEAMTTHGLDLNSNADSATFQALLPRWIADHGPAVVLIDHLAKDKDNQARFAIGAQHKLAGIDGAAYLVRKHAEFARGARGIAQIIIAKDRPGHVRENAVGHGKVIGQFVLDASVDGNVLDAHLSIPDRGTGDGDVFRPTHLMTKVSRYIAANPGASKAAIETAISGKATVIRLALEQLTLEEYVTTRKGDRGKIEHVSIRPFLDDEDDTPGPATTGDTHTDDPDADQPDDPFELPPDTDEPPF